MARKIHVREHPRRAYVKRDRTPVAGTYVDDYYRAQLERLRTKKDILKTQEEIKRETVATEQKLIELKKDKMDLQDRLEKKKTDADASKLAKLKALEEHNKQLLSGLSWAANKAAGLVKAPFELISKIPEEKAKEPKPLLTDAEEKTYSLYVAGRIKDLPDSIKGRLGILPKPKKEVVGGKGVRVPTKAEFKAVAKRKRVAPAVPTKKVDADLEKLLA